MATLEATIPASMVQDLVATITTVILEQVLYSTVVCTWLLVVLVLLSLYNYTYIIVTGYSLGSFGSGYNGYGGYGGYRPFGFNQDREPNPLVRQAEVTTVCMHFVLRIYTCILCVVYTVFCRLYVDWLGPVTYNVYAFYSFLYCEYFHLLYTCTNIYIRKVQGMLFSQ